MQMLREIENLARKTPRIFFNQAYGSMSLAQTAALLFAIRATYAAGVKPEDEFAHFLEVSRDSGRLNEETVEWIDKIGRDDLTRSFIQEALSLEFDSWNVEKLVEEILANFERDKKSFNPSVNPEVFNLASLWMADCEEIRIVMAEGFGIPAIGYALKLAEQGKVVTVHCRHWHEDCLILADLLRFALMKEAPERLRMTAEPASETDFSGFTLVLPVVGAIKGNASVRPDVEQMEALLSGSGRGLVIVPFGVLFRTSGDDVQLKKRWVESGRLAAVGNIGSNGFQGWTMETALCLFRNKEETQKVDCSTVMMTLVDKVEARPDPTDLAKILFEGLTDERPYGFERAVATQKDIVEKEFNLTPRQYIKTTSDLEFEKYLSEYAHCPLSEIATVIKTQQLTQLTEEDKPDYPDGFASQFRMVLLPSHVDEFGVITFDWDGGGCYKQDSRLERQTLQFGDVLICIRGKVGVTTLFDRYAFDDQEQVEEFEANPYVVANQLWTVLRLKKNSPVKDPAYLARYFQSAVVQDQLAKLTGSTTLKQLKNSDLEAFPVILPDPGFLTEKMARLDIEQIREDREEMLEEFGRMRRQFRQLCY